MQDEDQGQVCLRIDRNSYLEVQNQARLPVEQMDQLTVQEVKSAVMSTGQNSSVGCKSSRSKDQSGNNRSKFPVSNSYSQRHLAKFEGLVEGLQVRGR